MELQDSDAVRLANAIRRHRDQRGDDRCWLDDEELYRELPEGYQPPQRDSCVELEMCRKYIASRHNKNTIYVSPQRRIEELERTINSIKQIVEEVKDWDPSGVYTSAVVRIRNLITNETKHY